MKAALISTSELALRRLQNFAAGKAFLSDCKFILVKLDNGFPKDAFDLLNQTGDLSSYQVFVLADLDNDRELAALLAVNLEARCLTSCFDLAEEEGAVKASREVYGGLASLNLVLRKLPLVVTLSEGVLQGREQEEGSGFSFEVLKVESPAAEMRVLSRQKIEKTVDLTTARKIVSAGRGVEKKEDLEIVANLARSLGAELGCSRPLSEDFKWLPLERQVGLTGETVKPDLYVAVGISGQVQHLVGMRDSKVVVAINNNARARIFEYCDYGVVGDLYEVVPLLSEKLAQES